jgi:hypothetical protein
MRTWLDLKSKLRARRPAGRRHDPQELPSRAEALEMAKAIIEMAVNAADQRADTVAWLIEVLERATPDRTAAVPERVI